MIVDTD